ncbi:MAG: SDR family oxidoreductase [Flavobacteriaceae bacterium]
MEQFADKVVWITGASSGIGKALTYALNKKGNRLIISSRNESELLEVKRGCLYPEKVEVLPLDLSKFEEMTSKVHAAIETFGSVDILVNNAGISQRSLIIDTDFEVYKRLIDINYLGTVALSKAILPHFISKAEGHYVVVTSLMGKFGSPLRSGYCAAKHALHGFFDVMRMEHQKDGIDVTMICPGFVQTNIAVNALIADGSLKNTNDSATASGMPADVFAGKMMKAMVAKKYEAYIGRKEVKGVYLKRFFPKLLHKVVLRSQVV